MVEERHDEVELSPEVKAEIQRRLAAHRLAPDQTLTWVEVEQLLDKAE